MSFLSDIFNIKLTDLIGNKSLKRNITNSFFYFGGSVIQFLVAIFTQPIYSKYLELGDFAIIGYFTAIQAILAPLFSLTLPFYYMSTYWQRDNNPDNANNLSFILNFLNVANAIVAIVSFILVSAYFKVFNISFPLLPFILIVIVNLFFEKYKTYYLIECRIKKNGLNFFLINLLQIFINTVFSLYFVVVLKGGAGGRMSGVMIGILGIAIFVIFKFITDGKYNFSLNLDKVKIIKALKYSIPLIISGYAYYPIGNIDRLFLERIGNTQEYGYYSIGLTISGFAGTFFLALYQSFEPDLYKFISQKQYKKYILFVTAYTFILAVLCILFILFSETIVSFLTSGRFTYSSHYANIFIIGLFFMQIGGFFEQLFTAFGATKFVMWRNIFIGIFCIITYYFMIENYQFFGANLSRVIISILYLLTGGLLFVIFMRSKSKDIKMS